MHDYFGEVGVEVAIPGAVNGGLAGPDRTKTSGKKKIHSDGVFRLCFLRYGRVTREGYRDSKSSKHEERHYGINVGDASLKQARAVDP